jgi:hypothetical protein
MRWNNANAIGASGCAEASAQLHIIRDMNPGTAAFRDGSVAPERKLVVSRGMIRFLLLCCPKA